MREGSDRNYHKSSESLRNFQVYGNCSVVLANSIRSSHRRKT